MKTFFQLREQKEQVTVGDYTTKHFDMCPSATALYSKIKDKTPMIHLVVENMMLQDLFFGLEKRGEAQGAIDADDLEKADHYAEMIMDNAEQMGLEEEHSYIDEVHMPRFEELAGLGDDEEEDDSEEEDMNEKTLTPAELKKREEIAKAIKRENPNMPMAKKMAIATATAKKVAEAKEDLSSVDNRRLAMIASSVNHPDKAAAKNELDRRRMQKEQAIEDAATYLLDENIDVNDLSEQQINELLGSIVKGAARLAYNGAKKAVVNNKGNFRFSTAGKADAADAQAKKLEKQNKDRERLKKAQERIRKAREQAMRESFDQIKDADLVERVVDYSKNLSGKSDGELKALHSIHQNQHRIAKLSNKSGLMYHHKLAMDTIDAERKRRGMKTESVEQIDELSKKTLGSYVKGASASAAGIASGVGRDVGAGKKAHPDDTRQLRNRLKGVQRATDKLTKEETELDEAGAFSYGAKKQRKGSLRDIIAKKAREYEKSQPVIEPKNQMVGTAKVTKEAAFDDESKAHDRHYEKQTPAVQNALDSLTRRGMSYKQAHAKISNPLGGHKLRKEITPIHEENLDEISAVKLGQYSVKAAGQGNKRLAGQKMADEKIRKKYGYSSDAKVAAGSLPKKESVDMTTFEKARAIIDKRGKGRG